MCGIVGIVGAREAAPVILDSLKRLEYRGYDFAGIATLVNGHIDRRRAEGKLGNLEAVLVARRCRHHRHRPYPLGHAWRTDGEQCASACTSRVAVVHNGIIENQPSCVTNWNQPVRFSTETDTETVAQLVDLEPEARHDADGGCRCSIPTVRRCLCVGDDLRRAPGTFCVGARHGAPLAVGFGDDRCSLGPMGLALAPLTQRIAYLNDGDWTIVDRKRRAVLRFRWSRR